MEKRLALLLLLGLSGCSETDDSGQPATTTCVENCDAGLEPCATLGGDADGDDVCQAIDNCPLAANPAQTDVDDDGMGNVCDPTPGECDDLGGDDDGDTICNQIDNCPTTSNVTQVDIDHDTIGDVCDPYVDDGSCAGLGGDVDQDNWCASEDNCVQVPNADQADTDEDGSGDACDPEECDGLDNDGDGVVDDGFDSDSDGHGDCIDECPGIPDTDNDTDGIVDCLDPCPADPVNDDDKDSFCGLVDNCPTTSNIYQTDTDGDGVGDACDTEECDGLDNDGDDGVDENLLDSDFDQSCDAIDPCPNDAINDPDGDGKCAMVDNCPYAANANQLDADGDDWGDACDIDSASACGTPAVLHPPGSVPVLYVYSPNDVDDLIVHPSMDLLFVAYGGFSPPYANQVVALHPTTPPSLAWALPVGSEPGPLAISSDGKILYVGLTGSNSVRMINVSERTACSTFPVKGTASYEAKEMVVLPGSPLKVLIAAAVEGSSFGRGVFVYDKGTPLPAKIEAAEGPRELALVSDSLVYGYHAGALYKLIVGPAGVTQAWKKSAALGSQDVQYHAGRLYGGNGRVIDPESQLVHGEFAAQGVFAVDVAFQEIYFGVSSQISVFNLNTFVFERDIDPNVSFLAQSIVRWGTQGLAILDDNIVVLPAAAGLDP